MSYNLRLFCALLNLNIVHMCLCLYYLQMLVTKITLRFGLTPSEPYVGDNGEEGVAFHWQEGDDRFIQLPLDELIGVDVQGSWTDSPQHEYVWTCSYVARVPSEK